MTGPTDLAAHGDELLADFTTERDQLKQLAPPAPHATEWQQTITDLTASLRVLQGAIDAAHRGDQKAVQDAVDQNRTINARIDGVARSIGLQVCGT
jgi:hypothetical protein